jgi:predicted phage terminase large subunit-like protein
MDINSFNKAPNNILQRLEEGMLSTSFKGFLQKSFSTVNPSKRLQNNWHIDLLCEYLEALEMGQIKRLIINIPPRYLKSVIVNVAWSSWLLAKNPAKRIISASYADSLSVKHSLDVKKIVNSHWFKQSFPEFKIDKSGSGENQKHKFITTQRGFRLATSVGGTLTGEGGDVLIIDDPHNPTHIFSATKRDFVKNWFEQSFSSRLDDKKKGIMLVIMQRLHEEDLCGYLLSQKDSQWHHLTLPALNFEPEKIIFPLSRAIYERQSQEPLHLEREGLEELERIKKDLGSFGFSAQYQQNPVLLQGSMLKAKWIKYYDFLPSAEQADGYFASLDTAIKTGVNNDYSACTIWQIDKGNYYLVDAYQFSVDFPLLKQKVLEIASFYPQIEAWLIEDKASGQSLIQELNLSDDFNIIPINPVKDKITRFAEILTLFESGRVYFPSNTAVQYRDIFMEVKKELLKFPKGKNDDLLDTVSQFLGWAKKKARRGAGVRIL